MREAVFDITLRDGPGAISLPAVAAELQTSVRSLSRTLRSADDLPMLGLQWVEKRQRKHLFDRLSREVLASDSLRRAVDSLLRLLPSTPAMADELRVWRLLIGAHARGSGWAGAARDERDRFLDAAARQLVAGLDLAQDEQQHGYDMICVLIEGVITRVCDGRLDPEAGAKLFRHHVTELLDARQHPGAA